MKKMKSKKDINLADPLLGLSEEEAERLLRGYGDIEKEVEQKPSNEEFNATDLGNAKRLVSRHKHQIRYFHVWKKWLVWDGKRWLMDDSGYILRLAKETAKNIYVEATTIHDETHRKMIARWGIQSESERRLRAMVSLAESEEGVPILPSQMDVNPWLFNCLSGTIDLRTGKPTLHDPKNRIMKMAPVTYNPNAVCPTWVKLLETIFGQNHALIKFIQRAIGYSLTGLTTEQVLFFLHGRGSNGKSTLIKIIMLLMGDYAQAADTKTFLVQKNESVRSDIARMVGKRFVAAVEAEGEKRLAEVLIKQLTGTDMITARFLYSEYFDFTPAFKIWLVANHKPVIQGTDNAIWRRICLIPFEVTITEDKKDQNLFEKLQSELSGILTWAVEGCLDWQKEGLKAPDEVKKATALYQEEMDIVGEFISECCVLGKEYKATPSTLYEAFRKWCESNGEVVESQKKFGGWLTEKGFKRGQSNGRWWHGIGLQD